MKTSVYFIAVATIALLAVASTEASNSYYHQKARIEVNWGNKEKCKNTRIPILPVYCLIKTRSQTSDLGVPSSYTSMNSGVGAFVVTAPVQTHSQNQPFLAGLR